MEEEIENTDKLVALAESPVSIALSDTQEEEKSKVYVLSNSLPVEPVFDPNNKVIDLKTRPGGLGTGVRPGFHVEDSSYLLSGWVGINKQLMTVNNTVNEDDGSIDDELIVNVELQHSLNELLDIKEKMEFMFLMEETVKQFYGGASNEIIWPLHHDIHKYVKRGEEEIKKLSEIYELVNEKIADRLIEKIRSDNDGKLPEGEMVWVQDYHLQTASKYLKEKAPQLNVGYVHHIPFPEINDELMNKFPEHVDFLKDMIIGILHADTISFHTEKYKENFLKSVENLGIITDEEELKKVRGKILVNPIGIPKTEIIQSLVEMVYNHSGRKEQVDKLESQKEAILPVFEKATKGDIDEYAIYNDLIDALEEKGYRDLNEAKKAKLKDVVKRFKYGITQEHKKEYDDISDAIREVGIITNDLITYENLDRIWKKYLLPKIKAKNEKSIAKNKKIDEAAAKKAKKDKKAKKQRKDSLVKGNLEINHEKINIGAVSRLDYTKGIHELLDGYIKFLREKREGGIANPGEKYQLNIVASTPRDIPAYIEYQKVVGKKMDAILEEFPESLTFVPGIDFENLALHNAVNDITIATSIKDGYLMAAAEAILVRDFSTSANLVEDIHKPSALIISEGAGIVESLSKNPETKEQDIPEVLSVVETNEDSIAEALHKQTNRIERERPLSKEEQKKNLDAFSNLVKRVNTAESSAKKGLDFLKSAVTIQLTLASGAVINRMAQFLRRSSTQSMGNLSSRRPSARELAQEQRVQEQRAQEQRQGQEPRRRRSRKGGIPRSVSFPGK